MEVIESMKNIKVDTEASPETLRLQLKEIVKIVLYLQTPKNTIF